MIFQNYPDAGQFSDQFDAAYLGDEQSYLKMLLAKAELPAPVKAEIAEKARTLIREIREVGLKNSSLDAFMHEYDLSSEEGIALMCLAEAMLRIPDSDTADDLIRDKLSSANWRSKSGKSDSFFVNASTWALMLTGKVLSKSKERSLGSVFKKMLQSGSEPVIRAAVGQAMRVLGKQFVMGRTMEEALMRAKDNEAKGYTYSYDMLGEAARTEQDAEKYYQAYQNAIIKIGQGCGGETIYDRAGISIKLSALHPRYEFAKRELVLKELTPRFLNLAQMAKKQNISLTMDAEEARVLTLSLEIFARVYAHESLSGWHGLGLAVQSYQKRAPFVLDWLLGLYEQHKRRIMVRLIKGAYWDAEIKFSQVTGAPGYPVFTRKAATDVSYIACTRQLLRHKAAFYPMFGSHNAYTVAAVLTLAKAHGDYEFQCLHGMGHGLYDHVVEKHQHACRIYAPVGGHKELLAYLVRRLLENGANTSFVNRIADSKAPVDTLLADPVVYIAEKNATPHPKIPLPRHIYGKQRINAKGYDLADTRALLALAEDLDKASKSVYKVTPIVSGKSRGGGETLSILSPTNTDIVVSKVTVATIEAVDLALAEATRAQLAWANTAVTVRSDCLRKAADLLEARMASFMAIAVKEAGKTIPDAIAEVREAIDFCRYYALQAEKICQPTILPGPTGERNQLTLHGRGVIACISPWNFPLAIFVGQVVAALVTGNAVIAKPAEQTPTIASFAVKLLHEAGIPVEVLHCLPGAGEVIGGRLTNDPRVAGVMFTGSTETARQINQTLAVRPGAIVPLIAETGGQNCMIVDSSALLEQVVVDVVSSAFHSAGQRCSALRVLYVQSDIADSLIEMLKGAMQTLTLGDPQYLQTDVGPVIDADALQVLEAHFHEMQVHASLIHQVKLSDACAKGHFFPPCAFEIKHIRQLKQEFFGPFLHVIRFQASQFDQVLKDISSSGYGLTQGLHSRISDRIEYLQSNLHVGNLYVNRNMIGAVVGVQPFGGEGLSGTGPKAGGPHYLLRLVNERTLSVDTTASGGNASLLMLSEESET